MTQMNTDVLFYPQMTQIGADDIRRSAGNDPRCAHRVFLSEAKNLSVCREIAFWCQ
jgi:hypothetical protein